ncbi:MAG TPA: hypothetical protein VN258_15910 [Mobilitalea sp.]|nr:hypothetical protein [Mobilitalea sp.]
MIGLFCESKASNNEEYKKVIKSRMNVMLLIFAIGCVTLAVALLAEFLWTVNIKEQMLGVYTGLGTGLIVGGAILWVRNLRILKDEEKLKQNRLNCTDERILEISNKAYRVATFVLLISLYAVGLIGGLFYPALVKVLLFLVCAFLLAYMIAYRIYEKQM